jgi:3-methyladenine DNA glycosylase/8-oxoguanine DNA glycosylase
MPLRAPDPVAPDVELDWESPWPIDMRLSLSRLRHGAFDPCHQVTDDGAVWRTTRMESGGCAYRLEQRDPHRINFRAWGPGAADAADGLPDLLGARDQFDGFDPDHPLVREAHRRNPGLRVPRTGRVMESLVPAILEQRVTTTESFAAWRWLLRMHGERAPLGAPELMRVPPEPSVWAQIPSWDWHRAGVDVHRARTVRACAAVASRLEECCELEHDQAAARLQVIPGVGPWTAAEVAQRALGDADAVSVGDYHLATFVGWALAGRAVDDDEMLELLEPWRPHRYRVIRLLHLSGFRAPRFATRMAPRQHLGF